MAFPAEATCPDLDLSAQCQVKCLDWNQKCTNVCPPDSECQLACGLALIDCLNNCPCFENCPNGCSGCGALECGEAETCTDPESDPNLILCEEEAQYRYSKCITQCAHGDVECFSTCNRVYDIELDDCPCRAGCPNGCPCPVFDCVDSIATTSARPTTTSTLDYTTINRSFDSVLVVNSKGSNLPLLTDLNGKHDPNFYFEFGENTEVDGSCSIMWHNQIYIFGGHSKRYQVSRVDNCVLHGVGNMPISHVNGACAAIEKKDLVLLCFDTSDAKHGKQCYASNEPDGFNNLAKIDVVQLAEFDHRFTRIAASNENFFVVGGWSPYNAKTELLSGDSLSWSTQQDYPYHRDISHADVIYVDDYFYIFGGQSYYSGLPMDIAHFHEPTKHWAKLGSLVTTRHGHSVILLDGAFLVVGGKGRKRTEVCEWSSDGMIFCNEQNPILNDYDLYPELFVVPHDYCKFQ